MLPFSLHVTTTIWILPDGINWLEAVDSFVTQQHRDDITEHISKVFEGHLIVPEVHHIPLVEQDPRSQQQRCRSDRRRYQLRYPIRVLGHQGDHDKRCRWSAGLHTPWARSLSSPSHLGPVAWSFSRHRWYQLWRNTWRRERRGRLWKTNHDEKP